MVKYLYRKTVLLAYDIGVHLAEWPRIALLKLADYSELIRNLEDSGAERVALVVPHPTDHLKFALHHLIKGLLKNDYTVVVLVPELARIQWLKKAYPQVLVEQRKQHGRDFGAWKEAIMAILQSSALCGKIKRLTLVNDSLYFNKSTPEIIEKITNTEKPWSCLFENFEYQYHAGSFLLSFDNRVLNHPVFQKYWRKYKPFSSRRHSIHFGEALLSKRLSRVLGRPHCILSTSTIMGKLREIEKADQIRSVLLRLWASPFIRSNAGKYLEKSFVGFGLRADGKGTYVEQEKENIEFEKELLAIDISMIPEIHNPTHVVGLLVNYLFLYPVKRDICLRNWHRISDVVTLMCGFTKEELTDIEQDLRQKGLPASIRGVRRILFEHGRV